MKFRRLEFVAGVGGKSSPSSLYAGTAVSGCMSGLSGSIT